MKTTRSEFLPVRELSYHVRHWGRDGAPKLFMLHGWMDVSASFQFLVDALQKDWHVLAPDWRGFGLSEWAQGDAYWYPDYLADLECILQHYSPNEPINLIGHSMGGNVATIYAGVRPARIAKLVNLEGFGLPVTSPSQKPGRLTNWLDELQKPPVLTTYASRADVAARLQKNNRRLSDARADFLAGFWAAPNAEGQWELRADPAHKRVNPELYQVEEALACWRQISAPVLWIEAEDSHLYSWIGTREQARQETDRRIAVIKRVQTAMIPDAGHMMHHDQPELLARLIEDFLG